MIYTKTNACRYRLRVRRAGLFLPREHGKQGLLDGIVDARSSLRSLVVVDDRRSHLAGVEGARFGAPQPLRWVSLY